MQIAEQKSAVFLRNRLALLGHKLTEDEALNLVVLMRSQGWKMTARDASQEMTENAQAVHTNELRWAKMWEAA